MYTQTPTCTHTCTHALTHTLAHTFAHTRTCSLTCPPIHLGTLTHTDIHNLHSVLWPLGVVPAYGLALHVFDLFIISVHCHHLPNKPMRSILSWLFSETTSNGLQAFLNLFIDSSRFSAIDSNNDLLLKTTTGRRKENEDINNIIFLPRWNYFLKLKHLLW